MENDSEINSPLASIVIYYVLLAMTVGFALLLLLLENLDQGGVSPTEIPFDIITILLAVMVLVEVFVVQMKITPLVKKQTTVQMVFVNGILGATQYTFIGVFGLLVALSRVPLLKSAKAGNKPAKGNN